MQLFAALLILILVSQLYAKASLRPRVSHKLAAAESDPYGKARFCAADL